MPAKSGFELVPQPGTRRPSDPVCRKDAVPGNYRQSRFARGILSGVSNQEGLQLAKWSAAEP
jgi:hypothetical protein